MSHGRRKRVLDVFEVGTGGSLGQAVDLFIMALIALNVLAVIVGTVEPIDRKFARFFYLFELFSVVVFTIEYVARVWSCIAE